MKNRINILLLLFLNLFYIKSLDLLNNIILTQEEDNFQTSSITKEFILARDEIENDENSEEIFSPYKFSSNIFDEGNYTFDTAFFLFMEKCLIFK